MNPDSFGEETLSSETPNNSNLRGAKDTTSTNPGERENPHLIMDSFELSDSEDDIVADKRRESSTCQMESIKREK